MLKNGYCMMRQWWMDGLMDAAKISRVKRSVDLLGKYDTMNHTNSNLKKWSLFSFFQLMTKIMGKGCSYMHCKPQSSTTYNVWNLRVAKVMKTPDTVERIKVNQTLCPLLSHESNDGILPYSSNPWSLFTASGSSEKIPVQCSYKYHNQFNPARNPESQ